MNELSSAALHLEVMPNDPFHDDPSAAGEVDFPGELPHRHRKDLRFLTSGPAGDRAGPSVDAIYRLAERRFASLQRWRTIRRLAAAAVLGISAGVTSAFLRGSDPLPPTEAPPVLVIEAPHPPAGSSVLHALAASRSHDQSPEEVARLMRLAVARDGSATTTAAEIAR